MARERNPDGPTTRQQIRRHLAAVAATPSELGTALDVTPGTALAHVEHIARSLEDDTATLLVRPPTCRSCSFDGFDDRLNRPSRCPECHAERVAEPAFRIDEE